MSDIDYQWGDFKDYCDDVGISLEHKDDWEPWWDVWCAAIRSILKVDE